MVCQTCGTDYAPDSLADDTATIAGLVSARLDGADDTIDALAVEILHVLHAGGRLPIRRDEWGVQLLAWNGRTRWTTFGDEGSARRFADRELADPGWTDATVLRRWTYKPTGWGPADV